MENLKKLTAVSLAVAMLAAFSGCGDQTWSYKTDNVSLSAGDYIYNLLNGYYQAYDMVDTPDEVDDILKAEVTDSDNDTTKTVEQFALDSADEETTKMIAVEELFKSFGLELDEGDYETYKAYTAQVWGSMKQTLESYGISEDSFNYCYAEYSVKSGQVFDYLYGEKGEKYVTDDELIKYYKDKYTGYAYFSLSMTDYDDEGNAVAKSDDEIKKAEEYFKAYADMINKDKKDYKDVVSKYTEDYELSYDPTYSGSYNKEESSLAEDVKTSLDKLSEGQAEFVKSGEGEDAMYYLVYKPVTDNIIDFLDDEEEEDEDTDTEELSIDIVESSDEAEETEESGEIEIYDLKTGYSHKSLLQEMKSDEFEDYLKEYAAGLNIQKNPAIVDKFKPKLFVSKDDE